MKSKQLNKDVPATLYVKEIAPEGIVIAVEYKGRRYNCLFSPKQVGELTTTLQAALKQLK